MWPTLTLPQEMRRLTIWLLNRFANTMLPRMLMHKRSHILTLPHHLLPKPSSTSNPALPHLDRAPCQQHGVGLSTDELLPTIGDWGRERGRAPTLPVYSEPVHTHLVHSHLVWLIWSTPYWCPLNTKFTRTQFSVWSIFVWSICTLLPQVRPLSPGPWSTYSLSSGPFPNGPLLSCPLTDGSPHAGHILIWSILL